MSDFRADLALGRSLEPPYIPSNLNYPMILWPMIWKKSINPGVQCIYLHFHSMLLLYRKKKKRNMT